MVGGEVAGVSEKKFFLKLIIYIKSVMAKKLNISFDTLKFFYEFWTPASCSAWSTSMYYYVIISYIYKRFR